MTAAPKANVDPDRDLVRRSKAGEAAAFESLVLKYQDPIFNAACRMLGNRDDAAEIAQDVFLRTYRAMDRFREDARFATYLWRTLINSVISLRRKRRVRQDMRTTPFGIPQNGTPALDPADAKADSPVKAAGDAEALAAIHQAIAGLEEEFRTAVVLRDVEGMDYGEIADILEVPVGTVKSRIHRARCQLREKLADYF